MTQSKGVLAKTWINTADKPSPLRIYYTQSGTYGARDDLSARSSMQTWIGLTRCISAFIEKYPLKGRGFTCTGRVVEEFGVYSVEVETMVKVG
jgi:hypothetical protein